MGRSLRRRGQFLVVVGALLGALVGVILGLAVGDGRTGPAVAAPTRARRAAAVPAPSTSQLTASPPAGSGDRADGHESTSRLRVQLVDRPGKAKSKAGKEGKRSRKGEHKGFGDHATGRSDMGKDK